MTFPRFQPVRSAHLPFQGWVVTVRSAGDAQGLAGYGCAPEGEL